MEDAGQNKKFHALVDPQPSAHRARNANRWQAWRCVKAPGLISPFTRNRVAGIPNTANIMEDQHNTAIGSTSSSGVPVANWKEWLRNVDLVLSKTEFVHCTAHWRQF